MREQSVVVSLPKDAFKLLSYCVKTPEDAHDLVGCCLCSLGSGKTICFEKDAEPVICPTNKLEKDVRMRELITGRILFLYSATRM
jgi:hypothetical protein